VFVRPASAHLANDLIDFGGIAHGVLATPRLLNTYFRMLATAPMNHKYDFAVRLVDVDHNLFDQRANQSLFRAHIGGGRLPYRLKVTRQRE